VVGEPD
jgi:hypothetical protein